MKKWPEELSREVKGERQEVRNHGADLAWEGGAASTESWACGNA